jgi:hypothetical protein
LRLGAVFGPVAVVLALVFLLPGSCGNPPSGRPLPTRSPSLRSPTPSATTKAPVVPSAVPPRTDLPVIDYGPAPEGFPKDLTPMSTVRLVEGLHPIGRIGAYDAPGGQAKAFLDPTISGVDVTMPILERRSGWVGVLLPSVNRTMAWVPPGSWTTVALRDQLVVARSTHQLYWLRNDTLVRSWPVTLGAVGQSTPLGRTFILGRSALPGYVYANTEVFALGAVPDDPGTVPGSLRGAHIGLHTWYNDDTLGKDATNGCIRLTKTGQQQLLAEIMPGTEVLVVDVFTPPTPAAPTPAAPAATRADRPA